MARPVKDPAKRWKDDSSLGKILMDLHFITRSQLHEAIRAKLASTGEQLLGEVLIAQGAVTRQQMLRALDLQQAARGHEVDFGQRIRDLMAGASVASEGVQNKLVELEALAKRASAAADRGTGKMLHLRSVGASDTPDAPPKDQPTE